MNMVTAAQTYNARPETVACPAPGCRASVGQPCRARKTHTARISRAISRHRRDEHRQHQRAAKAQQRVRQALYAGRPPVDCDHVTMLACCCSDAACQLFALLPLFTAASAAIEGEAAR